VAAGELADHRGDHEEARRALEDDLDATSPRNKRRYERYGFRATGEFAPKGGAPLCAMWREPKD
jgi:hypothetical protein